MPVDRHRRGETRVEPEPRHDQPDAVWSQEAQAVVARQLLDDEAFELCSVGSGLAESGRQHGYRRDARLAAFAHHLRDGGGRGADDRKLGFGRRLGDAGVGLDAADRLTAGVDRVDDPFEAGVDEVAQHDVTELSSLAAGTDHSHMGGVEQAVEVADAHRLAVKRNCVAPHARVRRPTSWRSSSHELRCPSPRAV